MLDKKKILVPIDFSDCSMNALKCAADLAHKIDGEIIALHVIETYDYNSDLGFNLDYSTELTKQISAKLDDFRAEHASMWGIRLSTKLTHGKTHKQIVQSANEVDADLIMMGTHGKSGVNSIGKFFLGTNAYRVVSTSTCPVLTIRDNVDKIEFKKILLPLDLTKTTTQKVDTAIGLAKQFGSIIHVVCIWEFFEEFFKDTDELNSKMDDVIEHIEAAGVEVEGAVIKQRDIANAILMYNDEVQTDLIIIMTRQESLVNELTMGGHSRKVIEKSLTPVLSLHPR